MSLSNNLSKQIEQLEKKLKNLLPLKKEQEEILWKKFRLEWNYNSNHIEGNTLTYSQTKLLFLFGKTEGDHDIREYEEMKAHDVAIKMVQQEADEKRPLTERFIRELNEKLLVEPFWKPAITESGEETQKQIIPGQYKTSPNSVRTATGEVFRYASPEETPAMMNDLVQWYRDALETENVDPVVLAAELHYRFVRIHPFDDGNGRVARLLMNYCLFYFNLPPVIIKSTEKDQYLTALNKADTGNRDAFHEYIGQQLVWSLNLNIKAAKGESVEEDEDLDKKIALLKREATIKLNQHSKSIKTPTSILQLCNNFLQPIKNNLSEKLTASYNDVFSNIDVELAFRLLDLRKIGPSGHPIFRKEYKETIVFLEQESKNTFDIEDNEIAVYHSILIEVLLQEFNYNNVKYFNIYQEYSFTLHPNHINVFLLKGDQKVFIKELPYVVVDADREIESITKFILTNVYNEVSQRISDIDPPTT